jgi:hypothetical protein
MRDRETWAVMRGETHKWGFCAFFAAHYGRLDLNGQTQTDQR